MFLVSPVLAWAPSEHDLEWVNNRKLESDMGDGIISVYVSRNAAPTNPVKDWVHTSPSNHEWTHTLPSTNDRWDFHAERYSGGDWWNLVRVETRADWTDPWVTRAETWGNGHRSVGWLIYTSSLVNYSNDEGSGEYSIWTRLTVRRDYGWFGSWTDYGIVQITFNY